MFIYKKQRNRTPQIPLIRQEDSYPDIRTCSTRWEFYFATDFVGINIMLSYHRLPIAHRHRCSFLLDEVIQYIHTALDRQIDGWKWIKQTSGIGCQQHCIVCYHIGLSPIFIPLHHTDNFFSEVSISSLSFDNLDHVWSVHRCQLRIWRQGIIETPMLYRGFRVHCWFCQPSVSCPSSAGRSSAISTGWNFSNWASFQTAMKVVWWGNHSLYGECESLLFQNLYIWLYWDT